MGGARAGLWISGLLQSRLLGKLTFEGPADPNPAADFNYAIRAASDEGHAEIVELLLADERVDPSDDNDRAIRWASEKGHAHVVELLLNDSRVDPSADEGYAIKLAERNGHKEVMNMLLRDHRILEWSG